MSRPTSQPMRRPIEAITFDFGNTLVPFTGPQMTATVTLFADRVRSIDPAISPAELIDAWHEERDRQLREEVPLGREADMETRAVRVLARLRGSPVPEPEARWVHEHAARFSTRDEIDALLETYVGAFVETTPVPPGVGELLRSLHADHRLAIISNWPVTAAIERFLDVAGWRPHFDAVVVSQTAGCIKPRPEIFRLAAAALEIESGPALLHVGDDLAADVGGAKALGWRAAWITQRPETSPLPVAEIGEPVEPDVEIPTVFDLRRALAVLEP